MRIAADEPQPLAGELPYARLSPRLRARLIDVMAMMLETAGALAVAAALRSSALTRMLGSAGRWQARLCGLSGRPQTT